MKRLAAAIALLALPAVADDAAGVYYCLEEAHAKGESVEQCIGGITEYCQEDPDFQTEQGAAACLGREALAWDGVLNGAYKELRDGLSETEAALLKEAQLAWIKDRDATCSFAEAFSSRYVDASAAQWAAHCKRDMTAHRAALLHDWRVRLQDF